MSKKKTKNKVIAVKQPQQEGSAAVSFGYEEMLSELEAIVAEAEVRLSEEAAAA